MWSSQRETRAASDILDLTAGYGAEAVFDFVGSQRRSSLATAVVAPDGALRFVGIGGGSFQFPSDLAAPGVPWGVDVRRSYGGTRQDQRMVSTWPEKGASSVDTQLYPLDEGDAPLPTSRKDGCAGGPFSCPDRSPGTGTCAQERRLRPPDLLVVP